MALSGTFSNAYKGYTYQISWSATQNVSGNYSTITCTHKLICASSYSLYINSRSNTCVINGASKSFTSAAISTGGGITITLGTTTHTVNHNSDGTGKFSITGTFNMQATIVSTYVGSIVTSGNATLNTIARSSSITSVGNVTLGKACNVKWTPASSGFKYKIKFTLGGWSYTTGYISPNTTSAYTYTGYTIPNTSALLDDIPNSTTEKMTATLYTYNSSNTQIGSASSKTFTVTVPSSVVPSVGTITLNPADINSQNILVQGKNKLTISVSGCSEGTGSSIKSYTFSGPGISSTTTNTSVTSSGTISNTGTLTYTVKVTDNRDRTTSKTATITCHAWSAPTIVFDAYRVSSNTSTAEDENGTFIRCTYTVKYSYVNGTNSRKSFSISGGSGSDNITYNSWTKTQTTGVNGIVTETGSAIIKNCPTTNTYNIYATVDDNYSGNSTSNKVTVFSAERILNIRKNGSGIAFGKIAGSDNVLDSKWQIRTDDAPNTMKNLTYRGANIISSTTNDTTANWVSQGNLATTYYNASGQINGQPGTYGFVVNFTNYAQQVHQLWMTQANGSLYHRGGNSNGFNDWRTVLDSTNYTSYVVAKPTSLYSSSSGTNGAITLSQSAADFTYLEIFYTDNNTRQPQSVKLYSPNGKYVSLSCIEPSTSGSESRVYIRVSGWTISGTSMTVGRSDLSGANRGVYGQLYPNANGTNSDVKVTQNNYIKIFRILGYK